MNDQLIMVIDDQPHTGWKEASITRSIERGAHDFNLSLSEIWNSQKQAKRRTIERGMLLQAYLNDDLLLTGYINNVRPVYDANIHTIRVSGRSRIGDLIKSSTTGKSFSNQSLVQICKALCKPFGINVHVDRSVSKVANQSFISTKRLDLGVPIWEFIEELARIRAVLLTSDANGDLVITRAGIGYADTAIALGENAKVASGNFSDDDLFSSYTVTAQQSREPGIALEGVDTVLPMATVTGHGRHRPIAFAADDDMNIAGCKTRAEWQKNVHEGRAESVVYTLTGWRQETGRIWTPNELVTVSDAYQGLVDQERLISETSLKLNGAGRNTEIKVLPKGAFALVPEVERAAQEGFIR